MVVPDERLAATPQLLSALLIFFPCQNFLPSFIIDLVLGGKKGEFSLLE